MLISNATAFIMFVYEGTLIFDLIVFFNISVCMEFQGQAPKIELYSRYCFELVNWNVDFFQPELVKIHRSVEQKKFVN